MTTTTDFTPVFLYTDHKSIDNAIAKNEALINPINNFIEQVETYFENELTADEVNDLLSKRMEWIAEQLEPQFPLPNAPLEMNLTASGLKADYTELENGSRNAPRMDSLLKVNGNRIEFDPIQVEQLKESYNHYTTNENQNFVLEKFQAIADQLNELKEAGYISDLTRNNYLVDGLMEYEGGKYGIFFKALQRIPANGWSARY